MEKEKIKIRKGEIRSIDCPLDLVDETIEFFLSNNWKMVFKIDDSSCFMQFESCSNAAEVNLNSSNIYMLSGHIRPYRKRQTRTELIGVNRR